MKAGEILADARGAWRDSLRQRLLNVDAQGRSGALAALVLGDGSGLSREDWQVLQDTGTVHLLVISGQHIGLLAGVMYLLIAGLARYGLWPRRLPWLPWACGLAFAAALGYGLLAGFDVPVRRACVMIGLVLLWRLRLRHLGAWWPLLLALNGVLLMDPLTSLQPGFWLSFAAVGVLIFTFGGRLGSLPWWQTWTRAQWMIAIGLSPLYSSSACRSASVGRWSIYSRCPGSVCWSCRLHCLAPCCCQCLMWARGCCGSPGAARLAVQGPGASGRAGARLGPYGDCVLDLGAGRRRRPAAANAGGVPLRWLGWPMLLLLVLPPRPTIAEGIAEVWLLDVGQGLAILVRTRHHNLLYDAGPRSAGMDMGARVVLPTLRKLGVEQLDLMLISHAHADHAGGAKAVVDAIPVRRIMGGEPFPRQTACSQMPARVAGTGIGTG